MKDHLNSLDRSNGLKSFLLFVGACSTSERMVEFVLDPEYGVNSLSNVSGASRSSHLLETVLEDEKIGDEALEFAVNSKSPLSVLFIREMSKFLLLNPCLSYETAQHFIEKSTSSKNHGLIV